jgi:hypothetical protein
MAHKCIPAKRVESRKGLTFLILLSPRRRKSTPQHLPRHSLSFLFPIDSVYSVCYNSTQICFQQRIGGGAMTIQSYNFISNNGSSSNIKNKNDLPTDWKRHTIINSITIRSNSLYWIWFNTMNPLGAMPKDGSYTIGVSDNINPSKKHSVHSQEHVNLSHGRSLAPNQTPNKAIRNKLSTFDATMKLVPVQIFHTTL